MRFHVAMDSIENENRVLKIFVVGLLLTVVGLSVGIVRTAQKEPLIIDRGCLSTSAHIVSAEVTKEEVFAFIELGLKARFDSGNTDDVYLSPEQVLAKAKEQSDLSRQHFRQVIMVNSTEFKDAESLVVDTDRLIATGEIRSAFRFPLLVQIAKVPRSESNPYGLIITDVRVIEPKKS